MSLSGDVRVDFQWREGDTPFDEKDGGFATIDMKTGDISLHDDGSFVTFEADQIAEVITKILALEALRTEALKNKELAMNTDLHTKGRAA